jgi:L-asparaginase
VPNIAVVTTGGTISSTSNSTGVSTPTVTGTDTVGSLSSAADIRILDIMSVDSAAMSLRDFDVVRSAVGTALEDPTIDGVVVLHGTDSMEECAFLVDLFHADSRSVVFTGAQRTSDHPESDGPANLEFAIAAAHDPSLRGRGVLIAFDGHLFPARGTIKIDTEGVAAFGSRPTSTRIDRTVLRARAIGDVRVDIVALYPGADRVALDAVVAAGARGVVLEALGAGNTNADVTLAVRDATDAGVMVALSTRVPHGSIVTTYGGGGGGSDLAAAGARGTGFLRPGQTRILLAALLAGNDLHRFDALCAEVLPGQLP